MGGLVGAALVADAQTVSIASDKPWPQPVGTPVTFTATQVPGRAHRWWLFDGQQWSLLKDWGTENTFTWTPNAMNPAYRIGV